jgi:hypothetical protein
MKCIPVEQKDKASGELIATHESVNAAARSLGKAASSIGNCCNGKLKSAYGYRWSYAAQAAETEDPDEEWIDFNGTSVSSRGRIRRPTATGTRVQDVSDYSLDGQTRIITIAGRKWQVYRLMAHLFHSMPDDASHVARLKDGNHDNLHVANVEVGTKRRRRADDIEDEQDTNRPRQATPGMQACKACGVEHPLEKFGTYTVNGNAKHRLECKQAQQARYRQAAKEAPRVDPSTVPLPERCVKCGTPPPEATFTWRTDGMKACWRTACNRCRAINAHGVAHHTAYRQREMNKDAEKFRAHNAATLLAWQHRNPDKMKNYRTRHDADPECRARALVTYVRQKHGDNVANVIVFEDGDALKNKMTAPCHYCDHAPAPGEKINGLDRIDPRGQYSDANTVPCCGVCNAMKLTFEADEFLQGVRDIITCRRADIDTLVNAARPLAFGGTAQRRAAQKEKMTVDAIPMDSRIDLWAGGCYLCGRSPALGIDRVDASKPYSVDNCRSCCTMCNYMKKDMSESEFLGQVSRIFQHTAWWVLGDTRGVLNTIGGPREPVAAMGTDGKPRIIFPSVHCATRVLGSARRRAPCVVRGVLWAPADIRAYKSQRLAPDETASIIRTLRGSG